MSQVFATSSSDSPSDSPDEERKEEDSLILLHQQKIDELQKLHAEVPALTEALQLDPTNQAISERLARAQDVSKDVDYLTIGPHLIIEYMKATTNEHREELRNRFYREALQIETPQLTVTSTQPIPGPSNQGGNQGNQVKKRERTVTKNTNSSSVNKKKAKTSTILTASTATMGQDATGDCQSCGNKQCTFYRRSTGDRICTLCGVAFQDNITCDWQDLSYDEKMAANIDAKSWRADPDDALEDGTHDEDDNHKLTRNAGFGINGLCDSETSGGNKYKYECRSYMLERLLSVQCLEHAKISADDFKTIYATLQKHRQYSVTGWTATDMRAFLKICKLPHLYKHVNYLLNYMSSKMPLRIDKEVQELFIEAFDKIEVHMNKYKSMLSDYRTPDRRSRPHYGYVCRQIAKILGQPGLVPHFPQLVSSEKVLLYDAFWKKICEEVGKF